MATTPTPASAVFPNEMRTIRDFQAFHRWLDAEKGFNEELYFLMILLNEEIGEVAKVLRHIHDAAKQHQQEQPPVNQDDALQEAFAVHRGDLGQELADCLAYIFKLANRAGVDLDDAYRAKMARNMTRTWHAPADAPNRPVRE